jgi:Flp pilus assembly pilin Flp
VHSYTLTTARRRPRGRRFRARDERGTTTAEYAIGTLAACAFAAVLYKILTGGAVASALSGLIHRALGIAG